MVKNYLSGIFGASPVHPLQVHMAKVTECTGELIKFFECVNNNDWDAAAKIRERVKQFENEADDLKHQIRLNLPNTLFMPVARADLLGLLTTQDKIANKAKDITGIMMGRKMTLPIGLGDFFTAYVKRANDATLHAQKAVNELDELFETGFRGTEAKVVKAMISDLDAVEKDTDTLQIELRAKMFEIENDMPPINAMFMYKIIEWIGDLGDLAQRVGSRLQLLLAR